MWILMQIFFFFKSQSCSNIWVGNQSKKKKEQFKIQSDFSQANQQRGSLLRVQSDRLTDLRDAPKPSANVESRSRYPLHPHRLHPGENASETHFFFFLEVGVDVREAEQRDGRKCARPLPSTQIPPGVPSSGKPLTGSSQAFTFSKEPAAPGKSGVVTGVDGETSGRGLRRKWRTKGKGRQKLFKLLSPQTVCARKALLFVFSCQALLG